MTTRLTGGSERGRLIRASRSSGLRPTSERVRAAVFSMIGRGAVESMDALDLYAGSGAMGIEALSRGAGRVDFIERDTGRCRDIRANLEALGLGDRGQGTCKAGRTRAGGAEADLWLGADRPTL